MNVLLRSARAGFFCNLAGNSVNKWAAAAQILSKSISSANQNAAQNDEWRTIYKLPLIRLASAFNRLKLYQAALTAVGLPISQVLVNMGEISQESIGVIATVGVTGLITLTLGSMAFKNLVGIIYINQQGDSLKLAYIDFWGKRKNIITKIDNLVPEWDIPKSRYAYYQPIKTSDNAKETYKLVQRFGVVTESHTFASLFGD